jgi:hypothetical protein
MLAWSAQELTPARVENRPFRVRADRQLSPDLYAPPIPMARDRSDPSEVTVTTKRLLSVVVTSWAGMAIALLLARATLFSNPVTLAEASGWLFLACGPAAAFFFIAKASAAPTTADMLRDGAHLHDRQVPAAVEVREVAGRR